MDIDAARDAQGLDRSLYLGDGFHARVPVSGELADSRIRQTGSSSDLSEGDLRGYEALPDVLSSECDPIHGAYPIARISAPSSTRKGERAEIRSPGYLRFMEDAFPLLIKALIKAAGSDRKLSARTKVGASTLNDWAAGKSPSLQYICRAASNLDIRPAQLLCFEPLPYRFVERLRGEHLPDDLEQERRRLRYEIRVLEERRRVLEDDLDRVLAEMGRTNDLDQARVPA